MSRILILSQAYVESSTDYLCKWLLYYGIPFTRYNGEDLFTLNSLNDLPTDEDYSLVWYRRRITSFPNVNYSLREDQFDNQYTLKRFLNEEFTALHSLLFHRIDKTKWINDPFVEMNLNKLQILKMAAKHHIKVPFSDVVTTREALIKLLNRFPEVIIKPLSEVIFLEDVDKNYYKMLTKVINRKNIKYAPERFFPSLVQENITKKMELRIFYLYGKCYAMAIYSQNNKNTVQDFRNYDMKRPNRNVPFKLPTAIAENICSLMEELSFHTGSIDMILTPQDEYYFLEINPEGQFGMVSYPCNYYLEKEMAKVIQEKIKT